MPYQAICLLNYRFVPFRYLSSSADSLSRLDGVKGSLLHVTPAATIVRGRLRRGERGDHTVTGVAEQEPVMRHEGRPHRARVCLPPTGRTSPLGHPDMMSQSPLQRGRLRRNFETLVSRLIRDKVGGYPVRIEIANPDQSALVGIGSNSGGLESA
jgi:hypothetical protein